jgi:rubrerythrin
MGTIRSAAELYAHAIAVEREAAERYAEFAQRMNDLGDEEVASVFARLAGLEVGHLAALERRTAGIALPRLETHEYRWLDAGAEDPALRALAREMAADEREHVAMTEELLARTPEALVDWASVYHVS